MKKLAIFLIAAGFACGARAQQASTTSEKSVFERVTKMEQKMDWFHFYLNMQGAFNLKFNYPGEYNGLSEASFNMAQFRLEAKGNITPWLSYRWRQRMNRPNNGSGTIDNMPTSIDIAGIGVRLSDKFSLFAGKQCASYGGIEFDLNPIEIYEYCDMIEYMSNFMTGLNVAWQINDAQQLQFQILDSRNGSVEDTYGNIAADGVEDGRAPLLYTLNWNGDFGQGTFQTRWSASVMSEAAEKQMYYVALGNKLTCGDFNMYLDFMYSSEDIDRKGIVTSMLGNENGHNRFNAEYLSLVAKFNYRFAPRWNAFVKGMYETASLSDEAADAEKGKYRTAYGYFAGVEYYPLEDSNLHFFCTFVGRSYDFTARAGLNNYDTQRLSIGFIYQLPMF